MSPVMHGWPPDLAAELHLTSNDCAYDRQQQSFTLNNGPYAPPSMLRTLYSHTPPNHGHRYFSSIGQSNGQHHIDMDTDYGAIMNEVSNNVFDIAPPNQLRSRTQYMCPTPLLDFGYGDFVQGLDAAQTVSPAQLSVHHPTTSKSATSILGETRQSKPSSSTKSSSHISTPSLTPQTPDGCCSTPETSINGAAGDIHNASLTFSPGGLRLQRYKNILPAPLRCGTQEADAALETQLLEWPQIPAHQAFNDETALSESFLAPNHLPAHKSTRSQLDQADQLPGELDWLGSHSTFSEQPGFLDTGKTFDFDCNEDGEHNNDSTISRYPPITDTGISTFDPAAVRRDSISSQYGKSLYLPHLSLEMDNNLFESDPSGPYTDLFGTDETADLYQSIEPRSAGTECGEGSRRDTSRDDELLRLRMRGISYREIKQKYGFTEAESTLRGRHRSLTKSKDRRVRKPIWNDRDVS